MAAHQHSGVVRRHRTAQIVLRDYFLKWQCRARQTAMRKNEGRPSVPMRPRVVVDGEVLTQITVLINRREQYSKTPELQHMVRRTTDPKERFDSALQMLAAEYFQRLEKFSDQMTALFGPAAPLVDRLLQQGECTLEFVQSRQYFAIPCSVKNLPERDPAYQATYWHNGLFNPAVPPAVQILAFTPDWSIAEANPEPS